VTYLTITPVMTSLSVTWKWNTRAEAIVVIISVRKGGDMLIALLLMLKRDG